MKTQTLAKGDTPMRAIEGLSYEPAACWKRLQAAKNSEFFFEDLEALLKERYAQFLEEMMGYERQCFINAHPYQRSEQRVDQSNGFYRRELTTRLGVMSLKVPRTRTGHYHTRVLERYQRQEPVINEALKEVFLLGLSTRQSGRALATLVEDFGQCRHGQCRGQGTGRFGWVLPSAPAQGRLPLPGLGRGECAHPAGGQSSAAHGPVRLWHHAAR
jgi:hypothetical protein